MPEISRFLGIVVRMYDRDHDPPHFHARYGSYAVMVYLESGVVEGRFPPRALRHVLEWAQLHREELARGLAAGARPKTVEADRPLE